MNTSEEHHSNFSHLDDLYKLRTKVMKLNKEARNACEGEACEEVILMEEKSQHLTRRIQESDEQLLSLTSKLRTLIGNYAGFSSVLELKHELSARVEKLKEENAEIMKKHKEEIEKLKEELQETKDTWSNILAVSHEETKKKFEEVETWWKEKLLTEEEESRSLRRKLEEANTSQELHEQMLKRQHEEELDNLRTQVELLQRTIAPSNCLDIFAQNMFSSKAEFDRNLMEKDSTIQDLKFKLKEAEDNIRHLRFLSLSRSTQKNPLTTAVGLLHKNKAGDVQNSWENNTSLHDNERGTVAEKHPKKELRKKCTKKRKLFSSLTFFSEEPK